MSADNSDVSDVNPEELAQMIEGIDFSDDEGKAKAKKSTESKNNKSSLKSSDINKNKPRKNIQFSVERKDASDDLTDLLGDNSKKVNNRVTPDSNLLATDSAMASSRPSSGRRSGPAKPTVSFDDDDDILSGLDGGGSKPTRTNTAAGRKAATTPGSSFMDSLFGGDINKEDNSASKKNEFVLDDKYKKPATTTSTSSTVAASSGEGNRPRRRGAATITSDGPNAPSNNTLKIDDDKLFQGTSLAAGSGFGQPQQQSAPTSLQQQAGGGPPSWLQNKPQTAPHQPHQPPSVVVATPPTASSAHISAPAYSANQSLITSHEAQIRQMQAMERQEQEQFHHLLEEQRRLLEARQLEHRAALEQQKHLCQDQVRAMQEHQTQIIQQQQVQAEMVMKQIQSQMESELRMKSDLIRNQLRIMSDIQMQKPEEAIDLKGLMEQIANHSSSGDATSSLTGKEAKNKESLEELESFFRQKEDRLRVAHSEHVDELEDRIGTLVKRNKTLIESHGKELEEERERRRKDLSEQAEEHKETLQRIKSEYAVTIDRLREMQHEAGKIDEERGLVTRDVQVLLSQVSSNTKDLDGLHEKVEGKISKQLDVRQELLRQRDKTIEELRAKVDSSEKSHEARVDALKRELEECEGRSNAREIQFAQREKEIHAAEIDLEMKMRRHELEKDIAKRKIDEERKKLKLEKSVLSTERDALRRVVNDQTEAFAEQRTQEFIRRKLNKNSTNNEVDEAEMPDISEALEGKDTKSELKGVIKALTNQKAELDSRKDKLKEHERKCKERKLKLKEERKSILEAASRLAWAEKRFEDRIKETEQLAEACGRLRTDCRTHLDNCKHLTQERIEVKNELQLQLEAFDRKEAKLEEKKRLLIQERKRLRNTKASVLCSKCRLSLADAEDEMEIAVMAAAEETSRRTAGDGQNELMTAHLAGLKKDARMDEEFLAREARYLRNLEEN